MKRFILVLLPSVGGPRARRARCPNLQTLLRVLLMGNVMLSLATPPLFERARWGALSSWRFPVSLRGLSRRHKAV